MRLGLRLGFCVPSVDHDSSLVSSQETPHHATGAFVGSNVGPGVGSGVGSGVSPGVGECVGFFVTGAFVGSGVESSVGSAVGSEVGSGVGERVGSFVSSMRAGLFTVGSAVVSIDRIGLSVGYGVGWLDIGVKVSSVLAGISATSIGTGVFSTARTGLVGFSVVNVGSAAAKMVGLRDGWVEIVGLCVVRLRPALTKVSSD